MKNKLKKYKLNNKGSAIVTVLIVVLFLSVLATTILYLAGKNYVMKQSERKTIGSFYETETAVEEIKAKLVKIASDAYKDAYSKTLTQYAFTLDNKDLRRNYFLSAYQAYIVNEWNQELNTVGGAGKEADLLKSFVSDPNIYNPSIYTVTVTGGLDTTRLSNAIVELKGVSVQFKSSTGYVSKISTDFAIVIPDMEGDKEIDAADFVKYTNWVKE